MQIPFCLPLIDQDVIDEVNDTLTQTGWLTTGPKVRELEAEISQLTDKPVLCVNSWTSGAMLTLKWFGIKQGDEVIVPAYTYSATALCAMNLGAKVIMVDVGEDFNIDVDKIKPAITSRTKAILPVDIGGWPCDYNKILALVNSPETKLLFSPESDQQEKLGRILIISDAAHSLGAKYGNTPACNSADVTIFSLHSVKNITTGEGGAIALNLPDPFNPVDELSRLKVLSLNGQTKSAFEKNQPGAWRYDIVDQGLKINMPDICAAIGLAQIRKYASDLLPHRKRIFHQYNTAFKEYTWAILPPFKDDQSESSCHLYMLRIKGFTEAQRDLLIEKAAGMGIGVNVHYIPMPSLTLFKNMGYKSDAYPVTYELYQNEVTLPVYNSLTEMQVDYVSQSIIKAVTEIMHITV